MTRKKVTTKEKGPGAGNAETSAKKTTNAPKSIPGRRKKKVLSGLSDFRSLPKLAAYIDRIGATQKNFRRFVIEELRGRYRYAAASITLGEDGAIKAPAGYAPTPEERTSICMEFAALEVSLPSSSGTNLEAADKQRKALGVSEEDWFVILANERDRKDNRKKVLMCHQRVGEEETGGKFYLPWTYWSDGEWRSMEPDGLLPIWKPAKSSSKMIMLHEGAKAARYVDWLLNSKTDDRALALRAIHPWTADLKNYEHWGWIGGAPNSHRTDWSEVLAYADDIVIVADHDEEGEAAIKPIARIFENFRSPVWALMFDDSFPAAFDLGKPFPEVHWEKGRYRGPRLYDLWRSATIATKELPPKAEGGRPSHVLRRPFIQQWICSTTPLVFIHRSNPGRLLTENEFNNEVLPFSHIDNTARLLQRELTAKVDGIAYEPGANEGIVTVDGERCFNTWSPTRIGRLTGDVKPWNDFLEQLIPNQTERDDGKKWIATLIARPRIRMKYGLLLISEMTGVGKSTLMEKILYPIIGYQNVSVPSEGEIISGSFQSWIVRKRLVLVHEIYAGDSKKAYRKLSTYVTEHKLRADEKFLHPYTISNWAHFILSSNSKSALRLAEEDRRWEVPGITEIKRKEQYWIDFNEWLNGDGLEIIHQWAFDYVEEHGAVGLGAEAPLSVAKLRMIDDARSDGQKFVFDLGQAAVANTKQSVVLSDRDVRLWLANKRAIDPNHANMESLWTVRKMLRAAGMTELFETKRDGTRSTIYANAKGAKVMEGRKAKVSEDVKANGKFNAEFWESAEKEDECVSDPRNVHEF